MYRGLLLAGAAAIVGLPALVLEMPAQERVGLILASAIPLCFYLAGALAFWHRPEHRGAQRLLAVGSLHLVAFALAGLIVLMPPSGAAWLWPIDLVSSISFGLGFAAFTGLLVVFPDGEYHRAYERWLARAAAVAAVVLPVAGLLSEVRPPVVGGPGNPLLRTPSFLLLPALRPLASLQPLVWLAPVAAVVVLVLRYRRSSAERRAQMRWPLMSAILLGIGMVSTALVIRLFGEAVQALVFLTVACSLPASLVIGMFRHRLFDIDLVIRRSLVYAVLWLMIAAAYLGATATLGLAVGERLPAGPAIVLTIIAAMLFQPARRRLERLADHLVFGDRLSGYELIRNFGASIENTFDLST